MTFGGTRGSSFQMLNAHLINPPWHTPGSPAEARSGAGARQHDLKGPDARAVRRGDWVTACAAAIKEHAVTEMAEAPLKT